MNTTHSPHRWRSDNPSQLFLRLALGIVMFPHGAQKVLGMFGGPGWQETINTFAGLGFPAWSTILLMFLEFFGSILLILGLFTRLWATGFLISMSICMAMNHIQNGFFMNWFGQKQGEGFEFHILVFGICLALIFRGSGSFSLDRKLTSRLPGRQKAES